VLLTTRAEKWNTADLFYNQRFTVSASHAIICSAVPVLGLQGQVGTAKAISWFRTQRDLGNYHQILCTGTLVGLLLELIRCHDLEHPFMRFALL
jgi:hypothetical protein